MFWFGHIGDGNLHLNILKPATCRRTSSSPTAARSARVFEAVERHHGSISAEHGVGLVKRDYLGCARSQAIGLMRSLKAVFDPAGIMNPGKLLAPA